MSRKTLAERFAESKGAAQRVDEQIVHNVFRRQVARGERVRIRWLAAVDSPRQGIRLQVDQGRVKVAAEEVKDVVLWADTSPEVVEFSCETGKQQSGELLLWNCWTDEAGVMQAWIGDAGMVFDDSAARVRVRCSDGTHKFEPSDLVFEVEFDDQR